MPQASQEGEYGMLPGRGPSEKEQWALIARYGTVGIEMGLCVTFGFLIGQWFDGFLDSAPWGVNFGIFVGIAAAFKALWRMYKTIVADQRSSDREKENDAVDG